MKTPFYVIVDFEKLLLVLVKICNDKIFGNAKDELDELVYFYFLFVYDLIDIF